jgi:hypothetical protein
MVFKMPNEADKNAVIDLLQHNREVTDTPISKGTDISILRLEKHNEPINSMLNKLGRK